MTWTLYVLSVTDRILAATERGEVSKLCFVDLSKCFDVIDHELLIGRLEMHGIETSWFTAYLQGHTQSVSLKNGPGCRVMSRPLHNTMGVFQESALGPLLFTVFSNDLSLYFGDAADFQYADDTQQFVSGLQNDLDRLISRVEASTPIGLRCRTWFWRSLSTLKKTLCTYDSCVFFITFITPN